MQDYICFTGNLIKKSYLDEKKLSLKVFCELNELHQVNKMYSAPLV